jgi:hypothetical protein
MGDLFAPLLNLKQKLPKLPGIAEGEPVVASGLQMAAQAQNRERPGAAKKNSSAGKRPSPKKARKRI